MTEKRRGGPAKQATSPPARVFQHSQVIALPADLPGPDHAAVLATIQAGYRPCGPAYVESQEPTLDGVAVRVVWSVPIEGA